VTKSMTKAPMIRSLLLEGRSYDEIVSAIGCAKSAISFHASRLGMGRQFFDHRFDWATVRAFYDMGHTRSECMGRFGFKETTWTIAVRNGWVVLRQKSPKAPVLRRRAPRQQGTDRSGYTPEQRRDYTNAYRDRRRQYARERLGGVCVVCGCPDGLEFDHVDPGTKTMAIADMWTANRASFEAELDKCQLLCEDHHDEKSRLEFVAWNKGHGKDSHGTVTCYATHGCRCPSCREAHAKYQKARRRPR